MNFPRFKAGIGLKLFLALLAAGILMAAAMGLATRYSFRHGFIGYLNELESQRLAALSTALADAYRERAADAPAGDGWAFLRDRDEEWRRVLRTGERSFRLAREADRGAEAAPRGRTTLLDADRRVVAGNPSPGPDARIGEIRVDGRTVGWVANLPLRDITNAADLSFQDRQTSAAWFIAALAVLLAGAAAWALGRVVLLPARRLAQATHRLAEGGYATRVPVTSSDELGRLSADFNRLAGTLERNEQTRRAFMADVSHELRTPLAIMRGELEAIEDGLRPLDRRAIQSLQSEVKLLSKLVDDIHTLAVGEVGQAAVIRVPLDAGGLVEGGVEAMRERFAARGLQLGLARPAEPLPVEGDPDRLGQVLMNVLENAYRYVEPAAAAQSNPGSAGAVAPARSVAFVGDETAPAGVHVECRRDGAQVRIDVDDTGPGVPDAELGKLFDRFYRREASRNRATGGSGLGLAICRAIVVAHGGEIGAARSPLGGLRIRIRLPLAAPDARGSARSAP